MDPSVIGSMVTGLVGALSAYMTYKVGMKQAEQKADTAKPDKVKKGEAVAPLIEAAIQKYGRNDEKTALTGFQQNPKLFEAVLIHVLTDLATRSPEVAVQLQALSQQEGINTTGGQTAIGSNIYQADRGSAIHVNTEHQKGE